MKPIIIWGCGGHAREVHFLCEQIGIEVVGFLDERPHMKGQVVNDVPVLGVLDDITQLRDKIAVVSAGVGNPGLKRRFAELTVAADFDIAAALVHPAAQVSRRSTIGRGTIITAGCVVTVNARIGDHVIVNMQSTIAHDVLIGDYVTISPGVNVNGNVTIEEGAFIGSNLSIREQIRIGSWSVVGGGAFVRENVPERTLVAGVPAVVKKNLN